MSQHIKLSTAERWILINQYKIMEMMSKSEEDKKVHEDCQKILEWGFVQLYPQLIPIFHECSAERTQEILDILSMFESLYRAYERLSDKNGVDEALIRFSGFDGNDDEATCATFASLFCNSPIFGGRFETLKGRLLDCSNSNMPQLKAYRRMLAVWNELRAGQSDFRPNKADIIRIAESRCVAERS